MIEHTKTKPLKPNEKKFVSEYVKTQNGTQSAVKAYSNKNKASAAVQSSRLLKRDNIQAAIDNALNKVGATPEFAVNVLFEVAEQDKEIGARRLAAKDILELHGWNKSERPQTTLQINNSFFTDSRQKIDSEVVDV